MGQGLQGGRGHPVRRGGGRVSRETGVILSIGGKNYPVGLVLKQRRVMFPASPYLPS